MRAEAFLYLRGQHRGIRDGDDSHWIRPDGSFFFSLRTIAAALAVSGLGLSVWLIFLSHATRSATLITVGVAAACSALCIAATPILFDGLYESSCSKEEVAVGAFCRRRRKTEVE